MENDVVFNTYLSRIGYVLGTHDIMDSSKEQMCKGLDNILKAANDDYINGNISARQMLVITRFIYYYETKESED